MDTLTIAVNNIKSGGVIAYPTEAVYGVGCDPMNETAVMRLLQLKQRPIDKGLILIAATVEQLAPYIDINCLEYYPDVLDSWPGPQTWLLPCHRDTPRWLRGQHDTLALRVTAHQLTTSLCLAYGGAVVSTSANLSTHPPARTTDEVQHQFGDLLDYILPGETDQLADVTAIRDARSGQRIR